MPAAPAFDLTRTRPDCGESVPTIYHNEDPWLIDEEPPVGYAAWRFEVDGAEPVTADSPIQMRLLNAPQPSGIQGQLLWWNGDWLIFREESGYGSSDILGVGEVLFLPMRPAREYTIQARQAFGAAGTTAYTYSDISECTVSVGIDIEYGVPLDKLEYRTHQAIT